MLISLNAITKELVLACRQLGLQVSDALASLVARTIYSESSGTFYAEAGTLEEADARIVVEESVKKLFNGNRLPSVETLKLQAAYESASVEGEQAVESYYHHKREAERRAIERITEQQGPSGVTHDFSLLSALYTKITKLVVQRCKVPNIMCLQNNGKQKTFREQSSEATLEKEVTSILESVLPRVGLTRFIALTTAEKQSQMMELLNICHGIRLLNLRLKSKAGISMPDGVEVTQHLLHCWTDVDLDYIINHLQSEIQAETEACALFQSAVKKEPELGELFGDKIKIERKKTAQELIYCRQKLCYLLNLEEDFTGIKTRIGTYRVKFEEDMSVLQSKIHSNSGSLPKEEVYGHFDSLGRLATVIEKGLKLASEKMKLLELMVPSLGSFGKTESTTNVGIGGGSAAARYQPVLKKEVLDGLRALQELEKNSGSNNNNVVLRNPKADHIADEIQKLIQDTHGAQNQTLGIDQVDIDAGPTFRSMSNTEGFLSIPLDFQGFCVQSLVDLGLLVPGDPGIGVIQYKGRFCVFETVEGMKAFIRDPGHYFLGIREGCYRNPELIQPLRLHEDFPKSSLLGILQAGTTGTGTGPKVDGSCQTPMHMIEKNIDPSYEWNEWKLRRDALRMADIRRKSTNSTQTTGSTFRAERETQTYLPKENSTNTRHENGTQTAKWKRYVTGLRGNTTDMKIVNFKFEM